MLGPNTTMLNTTVEDLSSYPGANYSLTTATSDTNSSMVSPHTTLVSVLTNLSMSLIPSLDYSQLLYQPHCPGWVPLNHVYYQVANLLLLLASLAPCSRHGFLFLRAMLVISFSLSMAWGWSVACGLDIMAWNTALALINMAWCLHAVFTSRRVSLSPDMEILYNKMFKSLNVSKKQFKVL